jgi:tetratricopeptide (TPR) repeat protein
MRISGLASWIGVVALVLTSTGARGAADADPAALMDAAWETYDRWNGAFDFLAYEQPLRTSIDLWEEALRALPEDAVQTRSQVLNSLSQAYFELAEGYLIEPQEREEAYAAGKDAALASLRLDPVFVSTEAQDGFRAALLVARDIAAIFWYGNTLGQWLNYHQLTAILGGVRDVYASFQRSIELDEGYDGGGPHRAMASLIAQAHFVPGIAAAFDDAVFHFERAIELDPTYLESYVNYAEDYAEKIRDGEDLVASLLSTLFELAADPEVMAAHPFYNVRAVRRAERMAR